MDESNSPQSDYLLPGRVYDILKWLALIALPAVAWLVGALIGVSQLTSVKADEDGQ